MAAPGKFDTFNIVVERSTEDRWKILKLREVLGMDGLPGYILSTPYLTTNQKAKLAVVEPDYPSFIRQTRPDERVKALQTYFKGSDLEQRIFGYASALLEADRTLEAWHALGVLENSQLPEP
ncbi:MAG: hypothetical protein QM802_18175 [Agriterribacter sp.]